MNLNPYHLPVQFQACDLDIIPITDAEYNRPFPPFITLLEINPLLNMCDLPLITECPNNLNQYLCF
jgi:hypothetical protein